MPEFISRMLKQFQDFWKGLDKSQKIRIYITSGIVILAVGLGLFFLTRPSYTTVISDASAEDIAGMQKVLNEKSIPFKLTDDKKGIIVDVKDSDAAHVELVSAGYPKNGLTFADALSNIKINTTESDKKHIWQELDESDIARQLKLIQNVKSASVTITKPEKTLFIDESNNTDAKASVVITKDGEITPTQAKSIVKIVASSIEGLDPKNVSVVDQNGNTLNSDDNESSIEKTATQYDLKKQVKGDLEKNVREVLSGQLFDSFDGAKVVINPVLDFDTLSQTSKELSNPDGMDTGALISSKEVKEDLKNGDSSSAAAGVNSNPGNTPSYPMGSTDSKSYKKSDITKNFDYNETKKQSEKAVGEVIPEKTTAAITLLYGSRVPDDSKLTDDMITQVKDLVSKATGIPVANLAISKLKIQPPTEETPSTTEQIQSLISSYGLPALLLLMMVALIVVALPKRAKKEKKQQEVFTDELVLPHKYNVDVKQEPVPEIDIEERSEVKKQLEKFVKQKPDAVAQLLRNWLTDDYE